MVEFVRAIFAFQATQAGDLSFEEDEIITVLEKNNNGWWSGKIGHRVGDFPFNYVEPISPEEAARHMQAAMGGVVAPVQGDRVQQVTVTAEKKVVKFKIQATLTTGSTMNAVKTLSEFRQLDSVVKAFAPTFDGTLPPMWADNAYFNDESTERRARILNSYLRKLTGNEVMEYALMMWINPRAKPNASAAAKATVEKGMKEASAVSRRSFRQAMQSAPALAKVAYNWQPHDAVELELRKGEVIAVLNRQTLSPGWWEGQTAEGLKGLFPYNHVEPLEEKEASALVLGKYNDKSEKIVAVKPTKTVPKAQRERITVDGFAIASMESFDALLIDGFTMEKDGKMVTESAGESPGHGDHCVMTYVGYVWNCQLQQIAEFASSDLPDKQGKIAKLEFTIGRNEVIKGIELAAGFMEKGQSVRLIVKPELAYGDVGFPQLNIPPNVHLVYDLTLESFDEGLPGPPQAKQNEGGMDGQDPIPKTLAEAIALQAKKQASTTQTYQPIQNRPGRGHGNQVKGYKKEPTTQRAAVPISAPPSKKGPGKKKQGPKQYNLHKMREIVRLKQWEEYGVQPAFLEESLTDAAFEEAFHCDRNAFILMPRWKQMKMKKDADLY